VATGNEISAVSKNSADKNLWFFKTKIKLLNNNLTDMTVRSNPIIFELPQVPSYDPIPIN
jgi:hypothetical protein